MKHELDFIIIGAQKAATTSLYEYLRHHPDIYMPVGKEVPFFTDDRLFERGWDSYIKEFFKGASPQRLWGTASPQYMCDPRAPKRISDRLPQVKLIASLRNPVERAWSHYKMYVRMGAENKSFNQVVDYLLREDHLNSARTLRSNLESGQQCYIVWSEYGRIIEQYLKYFDRDNLLILFLDDLKHSHQGSLDQITEFLKLGKGFTPANLGQVYFRGGTRAKWPWLNAIRANVMFGDIVTRIFPHQWLRRVDWMIKTRNISVQSQDEWTDMDKPTLEKLRQFFHDDIKRLESITGVKTPWHDVRDSE